MGLYELPDTEPRIVAELLRQRRRIGQAIPLAEGTQVHEQDPFSALAGANTVYILSHIPLVDSDNVYVNGLRLRQSQYTLSGTTLTIVGTLTTADVIDVKYVRSADSRSADYQTAVAADQPTGWWKLDETAGTNASDSGTAGVPGVHIGGVTSGVAPLAAIKAATYDGTNDYTDIPSNAAWDFTAGFTVEAVFNATALGGTVVSRVETGDPVWALQFSGSAISGHVEIGGTGTSAVSGTIVTGTRYHVVMTHDETTIRLYVGGVEVATAAKVGQADFPGNDGSIFIGAHGAGTPTGFFNGTIDEVAVYNKVLTPARIAAHFAALP